jgi:DNA-binding HxlR family transcriptional regulator
MTGSGIPDLNYIKRQVPIAAVASALRLDVSGSGARCWRPEAHQYGDRSPSVSFSKRRNTGKCFVCDDRSWSNVDLVTMIRGCSVREAIHWIAERWAVPTIAKKHITERKSVPAARVGCGGSLEEIIRAGLWAQLSAPEKSTLIIFSELAPLGALRISYAGLARLTGVGSFSTISAVLKRFERIGLLKVQREPARDGVRACNKYALTLDSPALHSLLAAIHQTAKREAEAEREIRRRARLQRSRPTSLHLECSDARFATTPRVEWQIKKKPLSARNDDFPLHPECSGKSNGDNSQDNNFGRVVTEETVRRLALGN